MEQLCNEYFKEKLYGGKSKLARILDFLSLRLILFLSLFLYFSGLKAGVFLSLFLAFIAVTLLSITLFLIGSIRMDRLKERELEALRKSYAMEALSLLSEQRFRELVLERARKQHYGEADERAFFLILQKTAAIGKDELLAAQRKALEENCDRVVLLSLAPPDAEAEAFAKSSTMLFLVESQSFFFHIAKEERLLLDDKTLLLQLEKRLQAKREQQKKERNPFLRPRAKKYALLSFSLLLSSFFVAYPLYYRMMAGACATFAALTWFGGEMLPQKAG